MKQGDRLTTTVPNCHFLSDLDGVAWSVGEKVAQKVSNVNLKQPINTTETEFDMDLILRAIAHGNRSDKQGDREIADILTVHLIHQLEKPFLAKKKEE